MTVSLFQCYLVEKRIDRLTHPPTSPTNKRLRSVCSPLPEPTGSPASPDTSTTKAPRTGGGEGDGGGGGRGGVGAPGRVDQDGGEGEMCRRNPHVPQFPDTSPATCVQAFVDDAFGYFRPGGEVGSPLPLPVQVRALRAFRFCSVRIPGTLFHAYCCRSPEGGLTFPRLMRFVVVVSVDRALLSGFLALLCVFVGSSFCVCAHLRGCFHLRFAHTSAAAAGGWRPVNFSDTDMIPTHIIRVPVDHTAILRAFVSLRDGALCQHATRTGSNFVYHTYPRGALIGGTTGRIKTLWHFRRRRMHDHTSRPSTTRPNALPPLSPVPPEQTARRCHSS